MRSLLLAVFPLALLGQTTVAVDNPRVRILNALERPHSPTALHKHDLNRVMIYLDNADQDISHPGADTDHLHWKAGDVAWSPAGGMHVSENVGANPFRIVEIEIKQPGPAAEPKRTRNLDPLAIDPAHNKLIFENPQVRVLRANRDSGDREKWHEHTGAGRAVVLLSDLSARIESANGKLASLSGAPGDVFWTDGYIKHRGSNIGVRPMEMIIVELK
jgi:oxalate decarboxylase/phosphoglucose isomerase-like protein (cupin superfamily)